METENRHSAPDDVTLAPAQSDLVEDAQAATPLTDEKAFEPFLCVVSADIFRRVWQARSREPSRFNLCGVFIEPCREGGAQLTATDGHILVCLRDPEGYVKGRAVVQLGDLMLRGCKTQKSDIIGTERVLMIRREEFTLPVAMLAHVGNADSDISRDNAFAWLDEPNSHTIAVEYGDFVIADEYPNVAAIIPRDVEPGLSGISVNATLLKPIIEALKPHSGKTCKLSFFTAVDAPGSSPMLIKPDRTTIIGTGGLIDGFAIIMPMKDDATAGLPSWVADEPDRTLHEGDLFEGMIVFTDSGFTCIRPGRHEVRADDQGFFLRCDDGKHYLDAQADDHGKLVGIKKDIAFSPQPAPESTTDAQALYDQAVEFIRTERKASTTAMQKKFQIGYNRAAALIELLEANGVIGPANHVGKREIL